MSDKMEQIVSLCKRRGFVYPSGDIYGGLRGFWDYGPLGAKLKKNIRDAWWKDVVMASPLDPQTRDPLSIVPIDGSIITNSKVWEASGHADKFQDEFWLCPSCNQESREDEWAHEEADLRRCPQCAKSEHIEQNRVKVRRYDLMFKSEAGVLAGEKTQVFLRPETAQSIFINFNNVVNTNRLKMPFGIAQIGKAFRNEITPRHFTFRSREFEQMEIEWFFRPDPEAMKTWYAFWINARLAWWESIGISEEKLSLREHSKEELAHYAKEGLGTTDIMYEFPFGVSEIEGIAHRTDFDLKRHADVSGVSMEYFDQEAEARYYPHVIEPSAGLDRAVLAVLCDAYTPDPKRPCKEYMRIKPKIAPVKAAFFPLFNRDGMTEIAYALYSNYRRKYDCVFEPKGHIGKRYARMDEIGTPFCITIDSDTLSDNTVTVRFRDTMEQQRVDLQSLDSFLVYNLA